MLGSFLAAHRWRSDRAARCGAAVPSILSACVLFLHFIHNLLRRALDASILGTGGDEVIHCLLDMMYAMSPSAVMERAVHIQPAISELLPTMLQELKPL
jgi:hypothetical protein